MYLSSIHLAAIRYQIWKSMFALLTLTLASIISGSILETGVYDYCPWETFNATCPPGALVVMNSALYGRMKMSRCMDSDYEIGCRSDVLAQLDERCSGRPSCLVPLPDQTLQQLQPCKRDLLAYLEASYSCIAVSSVDSSLCLDSEPIRLTQTDGYLASYMAQAQGHGTSACPWMIVGRPGQRIRLSILGFSQGTRYRGGAGGGNPEATGRGGGGQGGGVDVEYCPVFAIVSEERRKNRVNMCAENTREKAIYTSTSHSIGVELSPSVVADSTISFIIRFSVFGCPDLNAPHNSWTERSGDRITVRCNDSGQSWHLVCKGTNWIGQTAECHGVPYGDKVVDDSAFPGYGLAIAVIIGIFAGAFCGFLLLAVVLWCRSRRSIPHSPRYGHNIELMTTAGGQVLDPPEHVCKVHRIPTGDYGYTHVWELRNTQLPMSTGALLDPTEHDAPDHGYNNGNGKPACHAAGGVDAAALGRSSEHSYECPMLDDRLLVNRVHQHHHHHVCASAQQRRPTVADQTLLLDGRTRSSESFEVLTTTTVSTAAESNGVDGGEDRGCEKPFRGGLNCAAAAASAAPAVSFVVLDQDPMLAKVPLKFENHYL